MRRYNQRLYRAARAITGDDGEAADVVQDVFVRAYARLEQFAGRASFGTWITQIAIHEALARLRRRGRLVALDDDTMPTLVSPVPSPEQCAANRELGTALEAAIDALPAVYRSVVMLRDVEGLSTAETAACLEIGEQTVKTRLHRARIVLRHQLVARARATLPAAFRFAGARCDALVAAVLARIRNASDQ
jgi:RNA polymerase sigma-70 factor (ECF subfamily)